MTHWKQTYEPYATIWRTVEDHARGRGLVHGQLAVDIMTGLRDGVARQPADAADLLADMVESGALQPVSKDTASVSHSVRAFRALTYGPKLGIDVAWSRAEAGLWTYRVP